MVMHGCDPQTFLCWTRSHSETSFAWNFAQKGAMYLFNAFTASLRHSGSLTL